MKPETNETQASNFPLLIEDLMLFNSSNNYISPYRIFFAYTKRIPNIITIDDLKMEPFQKWFEKKYQNEIIKQHYSHDFNNTKKVLDNSYHNYLLKNGLLVSIEYSSVYFFHTEEQKELVNELFEEAKKFLYSTKKTTDICLIYNQNGELNTQPVEIKKPKIDFNIHYNEDFHLIHKEIVKQLNKKDTNGLYLFHGQPGTGKSTYIKFLIHQLKKKVIFISPKMAGELDNLNMTPFLLNNKNTVFVIEDAEELITSREEVRNSNLSMLLNLTDGLLGESLGIQIIATFNTDVKNIDKALLRKGRLSQIYEFKPLSIERTNKLLNTLGITETVNQSLPVADIFNFEKENHYTPVLKKAVGFGK
ncbi:AAA family ATPase [Flavobacterium aciduliphilum]|uniref:ATPase family protein associated with various cellular activities (AAA) n=1 Tax=Flavobacterium aciduliphilum TaxID=1101402 RepID=A0A328YUV5_9FLAO|nr:AAA family ATPase [Flavobacterium aciduliphilum]RAR73836.1 ATPase family protein associated with various cellular activities (AAA) [Flavobacterium aciduliphilum]